MPVARRPGGHRQLGRQRADRLEPQAVRHGAALRGRCADGDRRRSASPGNRTRGNAVRGNGSDRRVGPVGVLGGGRHRARPNRGRGVHAAAGSSAARTTRTPTASSTIAATAVTVVMAVVRVPSLPTRTAAVRDRCTRGSATGGTIAVESCRADVRARDAPTMAATCPAVGRCSGRGSSIIGSRTCQGSGRSDPSGLRRSGARRHPPAGRPGSRGSPFPDSRGPRTRTPLPHAGAQVPGAASTVTRPGPMVRSPARRGSVRRVLRRPRGSGRRSRPGARPRCRAGTAAWRRAAARCRPRLPAREASPRRRYGAWWVRPGPSPRRGVRPRSAVVSFPDQAGMIQAAQLVRVGAPSRVVGRIDARTDPLDRDGPTASPGPRR